jgi:hypothetical protein
VKTFIKPILQIEYKDFLGVGMKLILGGWYFWDVFLIPTLEK